MWEILYYILLAIILSSIVFYFVSVFIAAYCVYTTILKRKTKEQWGRAVSDQSANHLKMDAIGIEWQKENDAYKEEVHIVHDGLNLYGEYYNFGFDKAVIILSGRTESLRYGYYFARPYSDLGFNVLVLDPRAHGLSDGVYNTVGFEESKDVLAWVNYLNETYALNSIMFHGICIGAAGGMLAITSPDCPENVVALVTEGMFANFGESMKNHLIERKKLMFPIMQAINFWMKVYTGHSMKKGPINYIHKMNKPLLMLQGKKDNYSLLEYAEKMYNLCPSESKRLVLFDEGAHSMLRITDTKKYDLAISQFIKDYFN